MKAQKIGNVTVADLLRMYSAAAVAHNEATVQGDHRTANKQHDIVATVYRELRARGPEAQRSLLGLLDHPSEAVRGWAAAHALEFAPEDGKPVLEAIAAGAGIWAFTAGVTLEEWKKGVLRFP